MRVVKERREEEKEVNYNIYTAGLIAYDIINDRKREATKERRWAQALKAKRDQAKSTS